MSDSSAEVEKLSKFKNKKLNMVILGIAVLLLVIILSFNKFFLYNGKIAKNVFVQGVEVSNMTQDQAFDKVSDKYNPRDLSLEYDKKNYKIHAKDID